ncbi:hypothetical protein A2U01_0085106, partial [Trifolium medium]|nr:hypothetical protein [Trifolium medium]
PSESKKQLLESRVDGVTVESRIVENQSHTTSITHQRRQIKTPSHQQLSTSPPQHNLITSNHHHHPISTPTISKRPQHPSGHNT